eukprot:5793695-Pyramimonas_sp.AAC.1
MVRCPLYSSSRREEEEETRRGRREKGIMGRREEEEVGRNGGDCPRVHWSHVGGRSDIVGGLSGAR